MAGRAGLRTVTECGHARPCGGLPEGVLTDDSQVKSLDGSRIKLDRERPRVEIVLRPLAGVEAP